MPETDVTHQSLLVEVKAAAARELMTRTLTIRGLRFRWEELFAEGPMSIGALERTDGTTWLLAVPEVANAVLHPWDWAHALLQSDLYASPAGRAIVAVEPNTIRNPLGLQQSRETAADLREDCTAKAQDSYWAVGAGYAWHLGDGYTQLAAARARVGSGGTRVRVAVLDTGYDPNHQTVPKFMRKDLGWNFLNNTADTTDYSNKWLVHNYGHGTGVISVLAGKAVSGSNITIGGAPEAEVVPIVPDASIVITDLTMDRWAKSFNHAIVRDCDLICMSAGGVSLVSNIIARAVNEAVMNTGIGVFAAVGNNFVKFPTHEVVIPARFDNVIGMTGACADYTNYYSNWPDRASANWGPDSVMHHVLTVFSPNIPRARINCPSTIDHDGWGTSQCAPQGAAAAALWLQMHGHKLAKPQRASAVYTALLRTAADKGNFSGWGKGFIRANDALNYAPGAAETFEPLEPASIGFPAFERLEALERYDPIERGMFVLEACQLLAGAGELQTALAASGGAEAAIAPPDVLESLGDITRASLAFRGVAQSRS